MKNMKHLMAIQQELKAPKGNYNSFGKYKYRSCEDILEAVKPLCAKHESVLTISDALVQVGERYYIRAQAVLHTPENTITVTGYAREAESKKGMDESQVTGTASSYARKYALNGLFCIDDTKDADTDEYHKQTTKVKETKPKQQGSNLATAEQKTEFLNECKRLNVKYEDIFKQIGITGKLTAEQHAKCMVVLAEIEESRKEKENE